MGIGWLGARINRNDHLLREARYLSATLRVVHKQSASNAPVELPTYTANNRSGTVVLLDEGFALKGASHQAELGWTNTCLGPGTLIITTGGAFVWREPSGTIRGLHIPDFNAVPFSWYLKDPVE